MSAYLNSRSTPVAIVSTQADDAKSLAAMFVHSDGFRCVGTYSGAAEALEDVLLSRPRVLLVDVEAADPSAIECARRLKFLLPDLKIILLVDQADESLDWFWRAVQAGADGLLSKPVAAFECLWAARAVLDNRPAISPSLLKKIVSWCPPWTECQSGARSFMTGKEYFPARADIGSSDKPIAANLAIDKSAAGGHFEKNHQNLEAHNRAGALAAWLARLPVPAPSDVLGAGGEGI
jgi:DNA-binding NarL/FixJ family response regulator